MLARRTRKRTARGRLDTGRVLAGVEEGRRDIDLFRLASKLRAADVPREYAEWLVAEAAEKCAPPFPRDEALAKVASAYDRFRPGKEASSRMFREVPEVEVCTGTDLLRMEFKRPPMIIQGIAPIGLTLLAGRPKVGKSWLTLGLGLAVAQGQDALGCRATERGDVLLIALEDNDRRMQTRIRMLLGHDKPELDSLHVCHKTPRVGKGFEQWLDGWLTKHPRTRLVAIDTLARIRPPKRGGRDVYQEDTEVGDALQQIAFRHEISVMTTHHVRKSLPADSSDLLETVSGTTAITGTADTILVLQKPRGACEGSLFVTGRDVAEKLWEVRFDAHRGHWSMTGEPAMPDVSDSRRKILAVLRRASKKMSPKEIALAAGIERSTVRRLLRKLHEGGLVEGAGSKYAIASHEDEV